ncbi:hypothetical protein [Amycolatopsis sp. MtRt-6]|uniref:hypothetical protein n=1 Tax=Amycolatopsis sp. MtRt-6 TaxID=2792782 RepID=UPI001A8C57A3|nr:hypothetical protein [Amycolatopsis sp. MtRt-6]
MRTSRATVSNVVGALYQEGLIVESGSPGPGEPPKQGRPGTLLKVPGQALGRPGGVAGRFPGGSAQVLACGDTHGARGR